MYKFSSPFETEISYKIESQSLMYLEFFKLHTYFQEHTL